jgi:penicillin-binding protein 1A
MNCRLLIVCCAAMLGPGLSAPGALPDFAHLVESPDALVFVVQSDGETVTLKDEIAPLWVPLNNIPEHFTKLLVFAEDRRFYWHPGVDIISLIRSAPEGFSGASTLEQQAYRNYWLSSKRGLGRKAREMIGAVVLDSKLSKEQILEIYCNRVNFGHGCYGVGAAARHYFQKEAKDLNLFESAVLLQALPGPSVRNWKTDREGAERRAEERLLRAAERDIISESDAKAAIRRGVRPGNRPYVRPEFAYLWERMAGDVQKILEGRDGTFYIHTTASPELQVYAQAALNSVVESYNKKGARVGEGSMVVLRNDGGILAYLGSRDRRRSQLDHVSRIARPCGSVAKIFLIPAVLESGYTLNSPFDDEPDRRGWPENFDGRYRRSLPFVTIVAESRNAGAVDAAREVGPREVAEVAARFGIDLTAGAERGGRLDPGLVLGYQNTRLIDLAEVVATIRNEGAEVLAWSVYAIRNENGRVIYSYPGPTGRQLLSPAVARETETALTRVVTSGKTWRGTGVRAAVKGVDGIGGKTGTSEDRRDALFVGFSPDFVAGVWVGNDNNESMGELVSGGTVPAEVWHKFATSYYKYRKRP